MASHDRDEQDAEERRMCLVFGFRGCPLQDSRCPKHKAWLGAGKKGYSYSERRTRQAVYDHLMHSPHHRGMTTVDAIEQAVFV